MPEWLSLGLWFLSILICLALDTYESAVPEKFKETYHKAEKLIIIIGTIIAIIWLIIPQAIKEFG